MMDKATIMIPRPITLLKNSAFASLFSNISTWLKMTTMMMMMKMMTMMTMMIMMTMLKMAKDFGYTGIFVNDHGGQNYNDYHC